jgi:hypothetical protein
MKMDNSKFDYMMAEFHMHVVLTLINLLAHDQMTHMNGVKIVTMGFKIYVIKNL